MSAQHTPGPWRLNKGNRKPIIGFDVKDGGPLLPIVPEVHGYSVAEAKRNARLISAAPEMLAALEHVASGKSGYLDKVRAAIAKATRSTS